MPKDEMRHIRDVMTPNPASVSERDNVREVAKIMKDRDTGVVPVVEGKKIIGLVTDRDIVVRLVANGRDPADCRVNEVMTKNVRKVRQDQTVNDALEVMTGAEVRRVPVVDERDELVGIVTLGDISVQTHADGRVGKAMEDISQARPNN